MTSKRWTTVAGGAVAGVIMLSALGAAFAKQGDAPIPFDAYPPGGAPIAEAKVALPQVATERRGSSVQTANARLEATVFSPQAPGRYPAVVFVHGAGSGPQENHFDLAERFARAGVVAVAYDKRSDYSFFNRDLAQLADDAAAAVAMARSLDNVDPARVGLWGISEGGRVVSIAAANNTEVAYVISVSAPLRGPLANLSWSVSEGVANAGGPASVATLVRRALGGVFPPTLLDDAPFDVWCQVRQPALIVFGTTDFLVPATQNAGEMIGCLNRAGNASYTVRFYANADHGLQVDGRLADGCLAAMVEFAKNPAGRGQVVGAAPEQRFTATEVAPAPIYAGGIAQILLTVLLAAAWVAAGVAARRVGPDSAGLMRASKRALAAAAVAQIALWLYVGLVIGLAYPRLGQGIVLQAGWAVTRAAALLAVIASSAMLVALISWLRGGSRPSRNQILVAGGLGAVPILTLLNLAYWGVFSFNW